MIPETLAAWTLEAVRQLLQMGVAEDELFDWKEMVPPAADEGGKLRVKEALAAFANSDGGFLILGVKDDRALSVDERVVGIEKQDAQLGRLNEYANSCDPPVRWLPKNLPIEQRPGNGLVVVQVPPSLRRPHRVVDRGRSSFPVRSQGATRQMTMTELRTQFADQSRRRRVLTFALSEVERIGRHAEEINLAARATGRDMVERGIDWWMTRYDSDLLASMLSELVEMLDGPELEGLHILMRDERASDRIATDFSYIRTQFGLQNLVPADGPRKGSSLTTRLG